MIRERVVVVGSMEVAILEGGRGAGGVVVWWCGVEMQNSTPCTTIRFSITRQKGGTPQHLHTLGSSNQSESPVHACYHTPTCSAGSGRSRATSLRLES